MENCWCVYNYTWIQLSLMLFYILNNKPLKYQYEICTNDWQINCCSMGYIPDLHHVSNNTVLSTNIIIHIT